MNCVMYWHVVDLKTDGLTSDLVVLSPYSLTHAVQCAWMWCLWCTASIKDLLGRCTQMSSSYADLNSVLAAVWAAENGEPTQLIHASIQALSATLRVTHVSDLAIFNVTDSDNRTHAVSLFPREKCTCPTSTTCCHINAAKRSIGIQTTVRKPLVLSMLRKNSRSVYVMLRLDNVWKVSLYVCVYGSYILLARPTSSCTGHRHDQDWI